MSETAFQQLFRLPAQHLPGCPILIEAGALLLHVPSQSLLAQLKLLPLNDKAPKAVIVRLELFDVTGGSLGSCEHQYLDLNTPADASFGSQTPIRISDNTARSYTVTVLTAIFQDGETWQNTDVQPHAALPEGEPLPFGGELLEQYRRSLGSKQLTLFPQRYDTLWMCGCRSWNISAREGCRTCRASLTRQQELASAEAVRPLLEQHKQQTAKASAARKRKITLVVTLCLSVVILLVLTYTVFLPGLFNGLGQKALESFDYAKAAEHFETAYNFPGSDWEKVEHAQMLHDLSTANMQAAYTEDGAAYYASIGSTNYPDYALLGVDNGKLWLKTAEIASRYAEVCNTPGYSRLLVKHVDSGYRGKTEYLLINPVTGTGTGTGLEYIADYGVSEGILWVKGHTAQSYTYYYYFYSADGRRIGGSYYDIAPFAGGHAAVRSSRTSNWSIIDRQGKTVTINSTYLSEEIKPLDNGCYIYKKDGKYGLLNAQGKIAIQPSYNSLTYVNGVCIAYRSGGVYHVLSCSGNSLLSPTANRIQAYHKGLSVGQGGSAEYYAIENGQLVLSDQMALYEDATARGSGFMYGNAYTGFNSISSPDTATETMGEFKNGLAVARKGTGYGYVNAQGKFVIPPEHQGATDFCGNVAVVNTTVDMPADAHGSRFALINREGSILVDNVQSYEFNGDVVLLRVTTLEGQVNMIYTSDGVRIF